MKQTGQNNTNRRVFITGIGALSAIGLNWADSLTSLREGKSGIREAKHFRSNFTDTMLFGEVDLSDDQLRKACGVTDQEFTRTSLLALHAFMEASTQAGISDLELKSFKTGLISSSTVGGMCYTDELYKDANRTAEPSVYIRSYEGSDHTLRLAKHFGIRGYTDTINTACSSSANAILLGARLIQSGRLDRVIVGGADSLAKYTVNGFNALMILSKDACKPFDMNREGLTLGEGAAYLVLEADDVVGSKKKYAEVVGCGNSNDAFHPSATSDNARGPILAMKIAIQHAGITPSQIDYINAHGTGTPNNDQTESFAFSQLFESVPPYHSTKSYTGHTLAAAGALEAAFSIHSLINRELYASLQCENPILDFPFSPIKAFEKVEKMEYALSNSFGFGGNCTSILLRHVPD